MYFLKYLFGAATLLVLVACANEANDQTAGNAGDTSIHADKANQTNDSSAARETATAANAGETMAAKPVDIPVPADVAAAPEDATKTASGLAYKVLTPGTGDTHPTAESVVVVHYTGWTTDGKMFDSSVKRGSPATFPLNGVIKGWTEGVQLMTVGEKSRFWIPGDLAYGETPRRPGAPAGTLVFDIELLEVK